MSHGRILFTKQDLEKAFKRSPRGLMMDIPWYTSFQEKNS